MATQSLVFDGYFRGDFEPRCFLWADEPTHDRVLFEIPAAVLKNVLGGGNGVNSERNVGLCERERLRIERACRRAFAERPGGRILIEPRHFQ